MFVACFGFKSPWSPRTDVFYSSPVVLQAALSSCLVNYTRVGSFRTKVLSVYQKYPVILIMERNVPISGKWIKPSLLLPKLPAMVAYKSMRFICPNSPVCTVVFFNKGDHFTY